MQSVSHWIHSEYECNIRLLCTSMQCAQGHKSIVQIQPRKEKRKLNVYSEACVLGGLKITICSAEFFVGKEQTVKIQLTDCKLCLCLFTFK